MWRLSLCCRAWPTRRGDVATTINGLIDEGVSIFKAGCDVSARAIRSTRLLQHWRIGSRNLQHHGPHLRFVCLSGLKATVITRASTVMPRPSSSTSLKTPRPWMVGPRYVLLQASSDDYSPGAGEVAKTINGILNG